MSLNTISSVLEPRQGPDQAETVHVGPVTFPFVAAGSGFLTRIDEQQLLEAALAADVVIELHVHLGAYLVDHVPIGRTWGFDDAVIKGDDLASIDAGVQAVVHTGFERTAAQDVGFRLRQLVDVAKKALSLEINDPTTAVHALGHISAVLCELAAHDLGLRQLRHDDVIRVVIRRQDLREVLETTLTQLRRYGAADPQVQVRLYTVLSDLAVRVPADLRVVVRDELGRLRRTTAAQDFDDAHRELLISLDRGVQQALTPASPRGTDRRASR